MQRGRQGLQIGRGSLLLQAERLPQDSLRLRQLQRLQRQISWT